MVWEWLGSWGLLVDPVTYTRYLDPAVAPVRLKPGTRQPRVCVVGTGFSGLGVCGALARHEIPFDAFEMDTAVRQTAAAQRSRTSPESGAAQHAWLAPLVMLHPAAACLRTIFHDRFAHAHAFAIACINPLGV